MNKRNITAFLTAIALACTGHAQDSSESASNAGHPSIFMWDIEESVDCDAMSTPAAARCVHAGDRFIAVDQSGAEPFSDVLIFIREKENLRYAFKASISLIMDSGEIHQIEVDFLEHVGNESNPIPKKFTVNNLPGGAGNETELKTCLERFAELNASSSIAYGKRVESCSRPSSVHWKIQTTSSSSQPSSMGPPDDGQGTGNGGN